MTFSVVIDYLEDFSSIQILIFRFYVRLIFQ